MTKSDICAKAEASGLLKPGVSMYPPAAASARPGQSEFIRPTHQDTCAPHAPLSSLAVISV